MTKKEYNSVQIKDLKILAQLSGIDINLKKTDLVNALIEKYGDKNPFQELNITIEEDATESREPAEPENVPKAREPRAAENETKSRERPKAENAAKPREPAEPENVPKAREPRAAENETKSRERATHENASSKRERPKAENANQEICENAAEPQETEKDDGLVDCSGILDIKGDGYGFLRQENLVASAKDVFVSPPLIKRFNLKTGDLIKGKGKNQLKDHNTQFNLCYLISVNNKPFTGQKRTAFDSLVPIFPDEKLKLENEDINDLSMRIIDLIAPIGKGQRGLIVSPPKAGKTMLLKNIANSITKNHPEVRLIILLIDERPEEVTDIRDSVDAYVVSSTFDEMTSRHISVSELCLEHAERFVESGQDVVILLDSITRLARAYNMEITPTGRSLSGGLDPGALYKPKKFFGAARNIRGGGSLTIIATALVDTGSKLDDVIYEEFKGTGNMELHLDRGLSDRRIFPAIDVIKSGTRREELLLDEKYLDASYRIRKYFASGKHNLYEGTENLIKVLKETKSNEEFVNRKNS